MMSLEVLVDKLDKCFHLLFVLVEVINKYRDKITSLEADIKAVESLEKEERELQLSEMQVNRINNMLEGNNGELERKWFQTKKEKSLEKGKYKL